MYSDLVNNRIFCASLDKRLSLLKNSYCTKRRGTGFGIAWANVINMREGWLSSEALASHFNPFSRRTVTCTTISRGMKRGMGAADHYAEPGVGAVHGAAPGRPWQGIGLKRAQKDKTGRQMGYLRPCWTSEMHCYRGAERICLISFDLSRRFVDRSCDMHLSSFSTYFYVREGVELYRVLDAIICMKYSNARN